MHLALWPSGLDGVGGPGAAGRPHSGWTGRSWGASLEAAGRGGRLGQAAR